MATFPARGSLRVVGGSGVVDSEHEASEVTAGSGAATAEGTGGVEGEAGGDATDAIHGIRRAEGAVRGGGRGGSRGDAGLCCEYGWKR